jgi:hypothetical protein
VRVNTEAKPDAARIEKLLAEAEKTYPVIPGQTPALRALSIAQHLRAEKSEAASAANSKWYALFKQERAGVSQGSPSGEGATA